MTVLAVLERTKIPCQETTVAVLTVLAVVPWKLKPGFINRVLVEVIFEASKCL